MNTQEDVQELHRVAADALGYLDEALVQRSTKRYRSLLPLRLRQQTDGMECLGVEFLAEQWKWLLPKAMTGLARTLRRERRSVFGELALPEAKVKAEMYRLTDDERGLSVFVVRSFLPRLNSFSGDMVMRVDVLAGVASA